MASTYVFRGKGQNKRMLGRGTKRRCHDWIFWHLSLRKIWRVVSVLLVMLNHFSHSLCLVQLKTDPAPQRGDGPCLDSTSGPRVTSASTACSWLPREHRSLGEQPELRPPAFLGSRSSLWAPGFSAHWESGRVNAWPPQRVLPLKSREYCTFLFSGGTEELWFSKWKSRVLPNIGII